MRRVNGSSCILLRGTLAILLLFVASTQYCHATRWHPDWDKNIKLFYNKLLNRGFQSQLSKSRRSITTGTDEIPPNRDRNKKVVEPTASEGMILGGHSTSTAFRLRRRKRGSFRLKKRNIGADAVIPLSYLDHYYALGKRRNDVYDEGIGSGRMYLGLPKTIQTARNPGDVVFEEAKRGSFRLKKIPEDSIQWSEPGPKRASFRLKRILDNYKDLLGSPSAGSSSSSAFRLRKRGGASSFRLKRIDEEGINEYGT